MKKRIFRKLTILLLCASFTLTGFTPAFAGAVIKKPARQSKTAAEYVTGKTTYYNPDHQRWISLKGSLLYTYKAKKNTKYYRPLYYLTGSWLSNNKQNLTVHLGRSRSKSVSSVVQSTLGISAPNTSLATGISRSYSSTISSSYTTDYTFVMKNYSTMYYYRPAFFGNILRYGVVKTHRILKRATVLNSYTFDSSSGLYLKLAKK